jgi:hypothetical protein
MSSHGGGRNHRREWDCSFMPASRFTGAFTIGADVLPYPGPEPHTIYRVLSFGNGTISELRVSILDFSSVEPSPGRYGENHHRWCSRLGLVCCGWGVGPGCFERNDGPMRISGLGNLGSLGTSTTDLSVPSCGDNPCTWWDEVWVRDACLTFLRCADPSNPLVVSMDQGFTAGVAAEAGQIAGSAVSGAASGLKSSLGIPGWAILGGIAIGGLVLIQTLVPRR